METSEKSLNGENSKLNVLIEFKLESKQMKTVTPGEFAKRLVRELGIQMDENYPPVSLRPSKIQAAMMSENNEETEHYVLKAEIKKKEIEVIEKHFSVAGIWDDPEIDFCSNRHWCPNDPERTPGDVDHFGTLSEILSIMQIETIRSQLKRFPAHDVYVGVVDGGITSTERVTVRPRSPLGTISNVVGGWPLHNWGTVARWTNYHGNAMAKLVQEVAPDCRLVDIRIAESGPIDFPTRLSNALQAYRWAISTFHHGYRDKFQDLPAGTPQILTNSWALFDTSWLDLRTGTYAQHMDHPFNRIVYEAIDAGMIVLFCAGNCGEYCSPDARCGLTGRSIWGANAHPDVLTVGAVTKYGAPVGYSSQGPAIINEIVADRGIFSYTTRSIDKPDLSCYTAFSGAYYSGTRIPNSGTSSSTALVAGVVALLKQLNPTANQRDIREALLSTARNIWEPDTPDPHSVGRGVIQPLRSFEALGSAVPAM